MTGGMGESLVAVATDDGHESWNTSDLVHGYWL